MKITAERWSETRVRPAEIEKYLLPGGADFIPDGEIEALLAGTGPPDPVRVREILARSLAVETLEPAETALLLRVRDPELLAEMAETAGAVKKKVYDNRIVTFAPLYLANRCVNNCLYCGFRSGNREMARGALDPGAVRREVEVLTGEIGHKRLIVVYGEHPDTGVDYMVETIGEIYRVRTGARGRRGQIRRVNVNAAPMPVSELRRLAAAGIGTYQVFQETYHRGSYARMHPARTPKGDFRWRLYSMHRAMEAGIDDVGIGALFGLHDWRFEVLALLFHARELERRFGVGPHTISFPRLEPAAGSPFSGNSPFAVGDDDFRRLVTVIRLSVPYTGMILTAREDAALRRSVIPLGCTQTDASTRIGLNAYHRGEGRQEGERQQFIIGDTRSLDEVVRELAEAGYITSFCTAGYRCGRTGENIMKLLRTGREGAFCKLNAVLTFREWLDDFASEETKRAGEKVIASEIREVRSRLGEKSYRRLMEYYRRIEGGERDLYF